MDESKKNEATKEEVKPDSVYPDVSAKPVAAPAEVEQSKSKSLTIPVNTIVMLIVALGVGVILGRTVLKAPPTVEEATKVLFEETFGELSEELENYDFSELE